MTAQDYGPHAASIRPFVAIVDGLVILCGGQHQCGLAVANREDTDFLAGQEQLRPRPPPRRTKTAVEQGVVDCGQSFVERLRNRDAFASRQPVRFTTMGAPCSRI